MLHSLKPFQCPECKSSYSAKDIPRSHNLAKFPRILTCGHSVCENCLQLADKNQRKFECPVCKEPVNLSDGDINEIFLPDVHALGIISANIKKSLPSFKLKMVDSKRNLYSDSTKSPGSGIVCGKCNQEQALWRCDECQLNFCSLCFKENHKERSKKRHEGKKIFAELYNSLVQQGCPVHENRSIEFFCEVDSELTCSYCMLMGDHVGHQVKTLVDKNKSCSEDLKAVLVDITNMQKQLKYTDHLLCEKIPGEKVDMTDTIKSVHEHFHTLHAALQLREAELISELTSISQQHVKPLEDMRLKVTNFERELASVKKDVESVIENPCLAISAPAILKKMEDNKHFPCYLVPLPGQAKKFSLNINLDSNLEKLIKDFGEIHFDGKAKYALLPDNDLPEDFCTEIPESFNCKIPSSVDTESCSETFSVFSEDSLSVGPSDSAHSGLKESLKLKDFNQMQPEKVIVTFIKDPSTFYIQRYNNIRELTSMGENIDRFCKGPESKKHRVLEAEKGDLYLVRYSADNRWYRGRVKSIKRPEDCNGVGNERMLKKDKDEIVEVFYIDYGNTELTSLANMKTIHQRFLKFPGMAKNCCLEGIQPANGDEWSAEAIKSFGSFVSNKPCVMQVFEERNNILSVDLSQVADDISNDVPVSVRDALVFLEHAVFESGIKKSKKKIKTEPNCMPPESLCLNSNVCVIVSHVDDPSTIYIQQMSTASYLGGLINEMTEIYSKDLNSMLHGIYVPRIGMMCAAQYSIDKQWYRARVIDLPGGAQVKVQYVDFGNTEVLHHQRLRKLFDKFFKLNIQAIPCKLAQVTYNQSRGWSNEAKKWLTEKCSRQQMTLKSLGTVPGESKTEVVLYFVQDDTEITLNALMVEEGFAESTGEYSKASRKKIPRKSPKKVEPPSDSVLSLRDMASAAIPPPYSIEPQVLLPFTLTEDEYELHIQQSQDYVAPEEPKSSPQRKYPSIAPPSGAEGKSYLEVYVNHIETPGSFYIQLCNDKMKLDTLMNDMQNAYKNVEEETEYKLEYTIGKAFAIYSKVQKKWFRGTVLSKISEDVFEVHFVDYGNNEEVNKKDFRKLQENFVAEESFTIRCHLDGIIPAGGSQKWPHTACDRFHQLVAPHDVLLLDSKGDYDKEMKSLPADLLIEELVRGGALEPTKIEYKSITAELISKGMALPIRRKNTSSPPPKSVNKSESDSIPSFSHSLETSNESVENCDNLFPSNIAPNSVLSHLPTIDNLPPPAKPTFQWKPAVHPAESAFNGYVTNIGDDGSIHLYVIHGDTSQVDTIKKALQFKYARSDDYERLKKAPTVGEACVAKFTIDQNWYRAEIISVYPGKCKVHFVDYGNNEIVALSDIRLDIIMKSFPRLCQECALYDIHNEANVKLDTDLLTFLHSQLVETRVKVEVVAPPDKKGRLQTKITTPSGINISELLMSMGFSDSTEVTVTHNSNSEMMKTFPPALELRVGDILPVCVTQMNSENFVCLQILKISQPKDDYETQHNETHDRFLQLISELREKAENFPKVKDAMPGISCCAKYSYDNNWYRCEVTDLTEDSIVVLYVDYGNSETTSSDNLRVMPNKFIDFPLQIHFCELHGLKPVGPKWEPEIQKSLMETLVANQELYAKVVVCGNIPQVDLLIQDEDGKFKLAYEYLIAKQLVVLDKTIT
ncbi:hypothetical protein JTE90_014602 [Oedothorax gibbosus]|uniref:RING finger protein 17 n=1 Tax=Oedothorax gibbosus TaxID=931172 RepID=A0AAV6V7Z3_9ARAC|nr:hypothetical protein JTE90_014602 [Oedothorax gibbosus]